MNWVAPRTRRDLVNSTQQHAQTMFINNNENEVRFLKQLNWLLQGACSPHGRVRNLPNTGSSTKSWPLMMG